MVQSKLVNQTLVKCQSKHFVNGFQNTLGKRSTIWHNLLLLFGIPQVVLVVMNLPANAQDVRDLGLIPGFGKIPWRRTWQPTPVVLPGESH